jgi:hypothetical protein
VVLRCPAFSASSRKAGKRDGVESEVVGVTTDSNGIAYTIISASLKCVTSDSSVKNSHEVLHIIQGSN